MSVVSLIGLPSRQRQVDHNLIVVAGDGDMHAGRYVDKADIGG